MLVIDPKNMRANFFISFLNLILKPTSRKEIPDWMYDKVAQQMKERTGLPFTDCTVSKKFAHYRVRFRQFKFIRETIGWFKWNKETNVVNILTTPDAWESFAHVSYFFHYPNYINLLCIMIKVFIILYSNK